MQLPQIRFTISLLLAILAFDSVSSQDPLLVPLTWETADYEFVATLGVGTPAHPFRLVVDTGSANLWIPSSTCTSLACTQRAQYNPQQSSTSKVLGTQVPISYGAGQVDSILVQDVISLPAPGNSSGGASGSGSSFTPGAAFTQTLGVAVKMRIDNSSSSAQQPWDGIMVRTLHKALMRVPVCDSVHWELCSHLNSGVSPQGLSIIDTMTVRTSYRCLVSCRSCHSDTAGFTPCLEPQVFLSTR